MQGENNISGQREECLSLELRTVMEQRLCNDLDDNKSVVDLFRHARGLPMLHHETVEQAIANLLMYRRKSYGARGAYGAAGSGDAIQPGGLNMNVSPAGSKPSMVGTRIHELLTSIGIQQQRDCGCASRQRQLDALPIDAIQSQREQIESMLNAQAEKLTMKQKLTAFASAIKQGIIINPLNPARSILDHAIKQAEAAHQKKARLDRL